MDQLKHVSAVVGFFFLYNHSLPKIRNVTCHIGRLWSFLF